MNVRPDAPVQTELVRYQLELTRLHWRQSLGYTREDYVPQQPKWWQTR